MSLWLVPQAESSNWMVLLLLKPLQGVTTGVPSNKDTTKWNHVKDGGRGGAFRPETQLGQCQ